MFIKIAYNCFQNNRVQYMNIFISFNFYVSHTHIHLFIIFHLSISLHIDSENEFEKRIKHAYTPHELLLL